MLLKQILNKLRFKTWEKRLLPVILAGIDAIAKFNQIFGLKIKILEIEKLKMKKKATKIIRNFKGIAFFKLLRYTFYTIKKLE